MTLNPLVSIIVRTKDRPKRLKRALKSIAAQDYRPVEVVLVNDGGCDLDVGELKGVLGDVSLNYIRLEKNTGRAHAGNVGIENAKGEYIGFLDDDDEFYPKHISTLVSLLSRVDYKVAYADSEILFEEFDSGTKEIIEVKKGTFASREFSFEELLADNYIPLISLLFSREALVSTESFDESFDLYEDWDLLIRCGYRYTFYHIKETTSKYVQWSKELQIAQSENYSKQAESTYDKVINKHRDKITPKIFRYLLGFRNQNQKLNDVIRDKDVHIGNLEAVIRDKDVHIGNLEAVIRDKDVHIGNLEAVIRDKDVHIGNLEAAIRDKDVHIGNLEAAIRDKDVHIGNLEAVVIDKDIHIGKLDAAVKYKDEHIGKLEAVVMDKEAYSVSFENEIRNKSSYIGSLENEVRDKDALINAMKNTRGWRILEKYRRVRNHILSLL